MLCLWASCHSLAGQQESLGDYIREGLENNLALKQKEVNYSKSLLVLRQSRSLFYPNISLDMRYSAAKGGRIIEFPVGTMLNPVYQSLNYLLGTQQFPEIENMEFSFYRPAEHDTRVRIVQPLLDPKIYYNARIKQEMSQAVRADAGTYRRELVAGIKTAYFNYLKTLRISQLLDETRKLLEENLRVNEKLYDNDKVTIDNVHRSKTEISKLDQQVATARKNNRVAAAYFNFLLNRPLESSISDDTSYDSIPDLPELAALSGQALNRREELQMLKSYARVADSYLSMNRNEQLPRLYASVDYGFQGTHYEFNNRQDYVFASLILHWNIFHGFETRARIEEVRMEQERLSARLEETRQQIRLQATEAYYDLMASMESVHAAEEELLSARNAYRIVDRRFREGQAPLLEYMDARTAMTQAGERLIISRYDYHIKFAALERASCLFPLESDQE